MCSNILLLFKIYGVKYFSLYVMILLILDWKKFFGKNNEMFLKIEVKLVSFLIGFLFFR